MVINLLGNAVKFSTSGEVVLRVQAREDHQYYFEVSDTGPGIPPERQAAVFESFQQEEEGMRHGGTGLGLCICRDLVRAAGGSITVESDEGRGAVFHVVLPTAQPHAAEPTHAPQSHVDCLIETT